MNMPIYLDKLPEKEEIPQDEKDKEALIKKIKELEKRIENLELRNAYLDRR